MDFNIPKIKRNVSKDNLRNVATKGRDAQDVLDIAQRSYLDRNYRTGWEVMAVQLVENKTLEDDFRTKKNEMKEDGRHARELVEQFAFLTMKDAKISQKVAQDGVKTREIPFNSLGNSKSGVYLCKHADVQLRLSETANQDTCQLMVFKVILGKSKALSVQANMMIDPTPHYDCHVNTVKPSPTDVISIQVMRSNLYFYEYNDDCEPVRRPRQCLPYALISYKMNKEAVQNSISASLTNRYNRPVKAPEPKPTESEIPVVTNRTKSDTTSSKVPSGYSFGRDSARFMSKQERRELFERQHAEALRKQAIQENRQTASSSSESGSTFVASGAFSKSQTRQDPRVKNAPFMPPQPANIIKPKSPTRGIDPRRTSQDVRHHRNQHLSVNIPRHRRMSSGSPSPDGDSLISDALTDLIVKNQVRVDATGRPVLPSPSKYENRSPQIGEFVGTPSPIAKGPMSQNIPGRSHTDVLGMATPSPQKLEEDINRKFAEEIQKHLQMTGAVELPQQSLEEDYTPQPMEIDSNEALEEEDKIEKNEDLEFDTKISELLNQASMKPIDTEELKVQAVPESQSTDSGNIDSKIPAKESPIKMEEQKEKSDKSQVKKEGKNDTKKDEKKSEKSVDSEEEDDDEKLVIAEMDIESKKLEEVEKRRKNKEGSLEKDLLTFVSRSDIKKKDPEKSNEGESESRKEKGDSTSPISIVVVKEQTMNKDEQMRMQREKVLREVQGMLERSKSYEQEFRDDGKDSSKQPNNLERPAKETAKNSENFKKTTPGKEPYNPFECESRFSSDSEHESDEEQYLHSRPQLYQNQHQGYYKESLAVHDRKGPYEVQTSPKPHQSKSDTWVQRDLFNAYSDHNRQMERPNEQSQRPQPPKPGFHGGPMHQSPGPPNQHQMPRPPFPSASQPQQIQPPSAQNQHQMPRPPIPSSSQPQPFPPSSPHNQHGIPRPPFPSTSQPQPFQQGSPHSQQAIPRPPLPPGSQPQQGSPHSQQGLPRPQLPPGSQPQLIQQASPHSQLGIPRPPLPPRSQPQQIHPHQSPNSQSQLPTSPFPQGQRYPPNQHSLPPHPFEPVPYPPRSDSGNYQPPYPTQSRSDSDLYQQQRRPNPFNLDQDYRPSQNMDFLQVKDVDFRQKSLIDVNPETGDVDYRRLNPVKQTPPVSGNHSTPPYPLQPLVMPQQNSSQAFGSPAPNLQGNSSMLSPSGPGAWGKPETIGYTSPSKEKKISYKDYKARRKNSPIRGEGPQKDGSFENALHTADLDVRNLKNILETVNVVSALSKDFGGQQNQGGDEESEPSVKHLGNLAFLNEVQDNEGLFNCYGGQQIPGLEVSPEKISLSTILGTKIDMKKFEKDVDMRQPEILDPEGKPIQRVHGKYPWEEFMHTTATNKMSPPSSASPRSKKKIKTTKKDMIGYVKRRRRKKNRFANDNASDITGETGSVASSDWRSSLEEFGKGRVMSLEEVGLNHWTDAINHPTFQPRVVLKREKKAEAGAALIAESLKSEIDVLDSEPDIKHKRVRQWVETSHKKIKLITLKRPKDDDSSSTKSGKSSILDDIIDIDGLVEKQIAQDMAKSDDAMSISSNDTIQVYQKPGPKCSKKMSHQSIPVLHKRKVVQSQPSISEASISTGSTIQIPTGIQSTSQSQYTPPYPLTPTYSFPPHGVHSSVASQPPYPQMPPNSGQGQLYPSTGYPAPQQVPSLGQSILQSINISQKPHNVPPQNVFSGLPPKQAPHTSVPQVGTPSIVSVPPPNLSVPPPVLPPSTSTGNLQQKPRLPGQQIRPIVAQANFFPRFPLYPKETNASSIPTVVTNSNTVTTSATDTTGSGKKGSDLADWFADKLNPKAAQELGNESSGNETDGTNKPKVGSLREELEKIKKDKQVGKEATPLERSRSGSKEGTQKRKSRSRSREKQKPKKTKGESGDIFEDSDNESKKSFSSFSTSSSNRRRSPERWGRRFYDSPRSRRRSFSPRRRRSFGRSYSRSWSRSRSRSRSTSYGRSPSRPRRYRSRSPRRSWTRSPRRSRSVSRSRFRRSRSPRRSRSRSRPRYRRFRSKSPYRARSRSRNRFSRSPSLRSRLDGKRSRSRTRSPRLTYRRSWSPDGKSRQRLQTNNQSKRSSRSPDTRRKDGMAGRRSSKSPTRRTENNSLNKSFERDETRSKEKKEMPKDPKTSKSDTNLPSEKEKTSVQKTSSLDKIPLPKQTNDEKVKKSLPTKTVDKMQILKQTAAVKPTVHNIPDKSSSVSDKVAENTETLDSSNSNTIVEEEEMIQPRPFLRGPLQVAADRKWTKSNFTEYTVDQIKEEDIKLQEELRKLEEQKKLLEEEDQKIQEEMRQKEDQRIRDELKELEKQRKIAEELLELQKQRELAEELAELERQKRLAEELIELERQRKIAEELVELEKKKKTAEEMELLNKRKKELEEEISKPLSEVNDPTSDELDELALKKAELQRALEALENADSQDSENFEEADKDSDVYINSSGLEDGEIEDDSEGENSKQGPMKSIPVIDLTDKSPTKPRNSGSYDKRRSGSGSRRSYSSERRSRSRSVSRDLRRSKSRSPDRKRSYSRDRRSRSHSRDRRLSRSRSKDRMRTRDRHRRSLSRDGRKNFSDFVEGEDLYTNENELYYSNDTDYNVEVRRKHTKEIGSAWGAMISHRDTRVERVKGDPVYEEPVIEKVEDEPLVEEDDEDEQIRKFLGKSNTLNAKIKRNELITAFDLAQEEKRAVARSRQEMVTFSDWLKIEYNMDDLEVAKFKKYITCVDIYSRIDANSKNKRKTLKKRLRAEIDAAKQLIELEEMKKKASSQPNAPARNVVISGVKERLETGNSGDRRVVCDRVDDPTSDIERLKEPFTISKQTMVSELDMVRAALKLSWKEKSESSQGQSSNGNYDDEFLMRHDLQQLEAEILMRINHYEFAGVPNRRVPDILLTQKEKNGHFSEEGLFLVLTASISHKAYQNLLSLRKKLESYEDTISKLNPIKDHTEINKILSEVEQLHQSRKSIMLTIAGYLTRKRFSKLSTRVKYYKRSIQYIHDLWKKESVFLNTTVADAEIHLKLGESLLQEQERVKNRPWALLAPGVILGAADVKSEKTSPPSSTGGAKLKNITETSRSNTQKSYPSTSNSRSSYTGSNNSGDKTSGTRYDDRSSSQRNPQRTVETKRYDPQPSSSYSSSSRNTDKSATSRSYSSNQRNVSASSSDTKSQSDTPKPVRSPLQRQNSGDKLVKPGQNDRSESRGQNDRSENRGQYDKSDSKASSGSLGESQSDKGGYQRRNIHINPNFCSGRPGQSGAITSPYTLPPARYLQTPPPQRTPVFNTQDQPSDFNSKGQRRSQTDKKLESDLIMVRNKLLVLSQQLRNDDSVRMSVQSVLLSVTEALNLLREESSNLPKVKEIILECLSRYNAVKELMEG